MKEFLVTAWYDTKIFGIIVGAMITLITFTLTQFITYIRESKKDKKNTLLIITQSNAQLFSLIYQGSLNEEKIDYIKLRAELEKSTVIYVLPKNIREPFACLYKIHCMDSDYYRKHKKSIHKYLVDIVNEIEKYGVGVFGDK